MVIKTARKGSKMTLILFWLGGEPSSAYCAISFVSPLLGGEGRQLSQISGREQQWVCVCVCLFNFIYISTIGLTPTGPTKWLCRWMQEDTSLTFSPMDIILSYKFSYFFLILKSMPKMYKTRRSVTAWFAYFSFFHSLMFNVRFIQILLCEFRGCLFNSSQICIWFLDVIVATGTLQVRCSSI